MIITLLTLLDREKNELLYAIYYAIVHEIPTEKSTIAQIMLCLLLSILNHYTAFYFSKLISRVQELALFKGISLIHQEKKNIVLLLGAIQAH